MQLAAQPTIRLQRRGYFVAVGRFCGRYGVALNNGFIANECGQPIRLSAG
jgi:hypothetical protein